MYAHIYTSVQKKSAEYASGVCFPKVRGPFLALSKMQAKPLNFNFLGRSIGGLGRSIGGQGRSIEGLGRSIGDLGRSQDPVRETTGHFKCL